MSDQELDDLFKEASAKYEVPFDEKDWDKMALLLDKPSSPKPGFWNWKIISGLALLFLISGTVLITQWDKISGDKIANQEDAEMITPSKEAISSVKTAESAHARRNDSMATEDGAIKSVKEDNALVPDAEREQKTLSSSSHSVSPSKVIATKRNSGAGNKEEQKDKALRRSSEILVKDLMDQQAKSNSNTTLNLNKKNEKQLRSGSDTPTKSDGDKESSEETLSVVAVRKSVNEKATKSAKKSGISNEEEKVTTSITSKNEKIEVKADEMVAGSNDGLGNEKESASLLAANKNNSITMPKANGEQKENASPLANVNNSSGASESDSAALLSSGRSLPKISREKSSDSSLVAVSPVKVDSAIDKVALRKEKRKNADTTKIHRFSLKLAISPDFSSIGYFKPGKTGFNYGLLAEYTITRHWSVTLGGIWSKKSYDDTQTEDLGYGAVNSTYINGSCRVLDLPLNINFYLTPQNAFSLYGSIGLSSYFMFDEDYTYDYVYGTKQYSYSKKIDRGSTEWFRMMNLSIGIQQQLSARMKLQLEPFIKAPLSGIGGGDLKLVSSGAFLNIKYTFK